MSGIKTEIINPKVRTHTVYKIGKKRLPSVTTVLGVGNMGGKWNALMAWQKRNLLAGIDPDKLRDEAADIGTLAHALIEEHLGGPVVELKDYSENNIETARVALTAYLDWESQHDIETIAVEQALTHGRLKFGGTADYICKLDGKFSLIDFKSTNRIYLDHELQLSAYQALVKYRYKKNPETYLLHLGKESPDFGIEYYADLSLHWDTFRTLRKLYQLNKELK